MRPTKTSYVILAFVILLVLVDVLFDNRMGRIWPLVAATWLLLLLLERVISLFQKLEIKREMNPSLFLGQTTELLYHTRNDSKRPIRLHTMVILPSGFSPFKHALHWNLAAHEQQSKAVKVTVTGTGEVTLRNIDASVLGWLALAWWDRQFSCMNTVTIRPDYRAHDPLRYRNALTRSTTFVINADKYNRLISGELRRLDHYVNHCMAVACQTLTAHRPVNLFVYDDKPRITMPGIKDPADLNKFILRLQELHNDSGEPAHHRCILNVLDRIPSPGLLIWYTDIDDAARTADLINIARFLKRRFRIVFYNLIDSETPLLADDLRDHSRGPCHDLAMLDLQQQWRNSQRLLQQTGIQYISR